MLGTALRIAAGLFAVGLTLNALWCLWSAATGRGAGPEGSYSARFRDRWMSLLYAVMSAVPAYALASKALYDRTVWPW